jgi:CheY-like chemotaxis protein
MTVDEIIKLLNAITELLNVLIYPGILLFILIRFGSVVQEFFSNLSELTLKGAGFEASVKKKQAEAAAALAVATVSKGDKGTTPNPAIKDVKFAADNVVKAVTPELIKRAEKAIILWVDDNPRNNMYEQQALEALGIHVVLAKSTEEALDYVNQQHFNVIISDMGRPPDPRAGYTLLDKLRLSGDRTPFIIYAGSRDPKHVAESRDRGAIGCTNNANELFEMVMSALGR